VIKVAETRTDRKCLVFPCEQFQTVSSTLV